MIASETTDDDVASSSSSEKSLCSNSSTEGVGASSIGRIAVLSCPCPVQLCVPSNPTASFPSLVHPTHPLTPHSHRSLECTTSVPDAECYGLVYTVKKGVDLSSMMAGIGMGGGGGGAAAAPAAPAMPAAPNANWTAVEELMAEVKRLKPKLKIKGFAGGEQEMDAWIKGKPKSISSDHPFVMLVQHSQ